MPGSRIVKKRSLRNGRVVLVPHPPLNNIQALICLSSRYLKKSSRYSRISALVEQQLPYVSAKQDLTLCAVAVSSATNDYIWSG